MTIDELANDANKALGCLYIAVDESVARDVGSKVKAYTDALTQRIQALEIVVKLQSEELAKP